MEDKNKKATQELDNDTLEQAAGGTVQAIYQPHVGFSSGPPKIIGYWSYDPKNPRNKKKFKTRKEAQEHSKEMGW